VIKINLAPPRVRARGSAGPGINLAVVFGGVALVLVVLLVGWGVLLSGELSGLRREIEQNRSEVARLKPIIAQGQRYRAEKEELERRVNAIETVARDQARPVYLFDALAEVLPGDLWLTKVEEKAQQLKLGGTTLSSVALSDFMANLKASGKFKDVDLVESRQDLTKSPRTITFEVTCRFEV
jgi:type IV pilus assembly protein PilN